MSCQVNRIPSNEIHSIDSICLPKRIDLLVKSITFSFQGYSILENFLLCSSCQQWSLLMKKLSFLISQFDISLVIEGILGIWNSIDGIMKFVLKTHQHSASVRIMSCLTILLSNRLGVKSNRAYSIYQCDNWGHNYLHSTLSKKPLTSSRRLQEKLCALWDQDSCQITARISQYSTRKTWSADLQVFKT